MEFPTRTFAVEHPTVRPKFGGDVVDGLVMEFPTRTFAVEVRCVCLARVDAAVKRMESRDHGRGPYFPPGEQWRQQNRPATATAVARIKKVNAAASEPQAAAARGCQEGRHRDLRAARGDSGPVCAAVSVRRSCCTRPVPWGRRARPVESARHQGE
jgi:hypothetical protein